MKSFLLSSFLLFTQFIVAQEFAEAYPSLITDVRASSVAFSDADGDSYPDMLVTGTSAASRAISILYMNDGNGNYVEREDNPFVDVYNGAVGFADVNNDSYPDVLITGRTGTEETDSRVAKLYTNDGNGNFTEVDGTPFVGVSASALAFEDVNGDNFLDVLITGRGNDDEPSTTLYINDGTGVFSIVENNPFPAVFNGSVDFSDVNGDSFPDVLITGDLDLSSPNDWIGSLFTNDGNGNFSIVANTPFEDVYYASADFADVNGDSSPDLVISGVDFFYTRLYINNGSGSFQADPNIPFTETYGGDIAFADMNGDSYLDFVITGWSHTSGLIAKIYANDGSGNFAEIPDTPFPGVTSSDIAIADVNGDTQSDLLITGSLPEGPISRLFTNDGSGSFTQVGGVNSPFIPVNNGTVDFADFNNDSHPDALITGSRRDFGDLVPTAKLFLNDGEGNYSELPNTTFPELDRSAVVIADFNNDSYNDIFFSGRTDWGDQVASLYFSAEMGTSFYEVTDTPFTAVEDGDAAAADVNGDGHPDLLITGYAGDSGAAGRISTLYINDGNGSFTELAGTPFPAVNGGTVSFADINNDTHLDLLITGFPEDDIPSFRITKLYLNDGNANFSEVVDTPFPGFSSGSANFADVNGDSYPDLLLTGSIVGEPFANRVVKLYLNDGNANFSEVSETPFYGLNISSAVFLDANGDSHLDVIICGIMVPEPGPEIPTTELFMNDGNGNFSEAANQPFLEVGYGAVTSADVNGDSFPDVLLIGHTATNTHSTKLYLNQSLLDGVFDEEEFSAIPINAYPNPSLNGRFNIDLQTLRATTLQLSVFDLSGKHYLLENQRLSAGPNTIIVDLTAYPKGMYVLRLDGPDGSSVLKLIYQ